MINTKLYEDIALKLFSDFTVGDRSNVENSKAGKTANSVKTAKASVKS